MYPVLYDDTYVPNLESNGIGVLDEAISCTVTEEKNGQYELTMTYPVCGKLFKELLARRMILAIPDNIQVAQVFDIYSVSKPTDGVVTVKAHHVSARLKRVLIEPFVSIGIWPTTWFTDLMDPNFTHVIGGSPGGLNGWVFSGDIGDSGYLDTAVTLSNYSNLYDIMMQENGPILGQSVVSNQNTTYFSGYGPDAFEYKFGYYTCEVLRARGKVKDITLRRDKNVKQITESYDDTETIHGVFPYWKGRSNLGEDVFKTLREYSHPAVVDGVVYSGPDDIDRVVVKDFSAVWEQEPTDPELLLAATDYVEIVNNNTSNSLSYSVDLAAYDKGLSPVDDCYLQLCDTVTIQDDILGVSTPLKIVSLTFDVLQEMVTNIVVGRLRPKVSTEFKRMNDIWIIDAEQTAKEETDASAEAKRGVSVTSYVQATRAASVQKIADVNVKERDGTTTTYPINAPSGGGGYPYWGRPATIIKIGEIRISDLKMTVRTHAVTALLNSVDTDGHTTNRIVTETQQDKWTARINPFEIPVLDPKSNYDSLNTYMVVSGQVGGRLGFFRVKIQSEQLFYLDTNPNDFYITIAIGHFIGLDNNYTDLYGGYWSYRGFEWVVCTGMHTLNSQDGDFTYTVTQGNL